MEAEASHGLSHRFAFHQALSASLQRGKDGFVAERFNARIGDVLKTNRSHSGEDLEQTWLRYVALYNC